MQNRLRSALLNRQVTIGTWLQAPHPVISEILGTIAFDWIVIDCEHSEIGLAEFASVVRGLHGRLPQPVARVRENDTLAIRQVLDLGATGIIVPLVGTAEDARRAVAAAKYPPAGIRGFSYVRANDYGTGFNEYVRTANDEIAVVAMAETRGAVENIDEIVSVDGIDGIFVGPYDLSGSYGMPGEIDHPQVVEAQRSVVAACATAGKSAGLLIAHPTRENVAAAKKAGFTFLSVGIDTVFLAEGGKRALDVAR